MHSLRTPLTIYKSETSVQLEVENTEALGNLSDFGESLLVSCRQGCGLLVNPGLNFAALGDCQRVGTDTWLSLFILHHRDRHDIGHLDEG